MMTSKLQFPLWWMGFSALGITCLVYQQTPGFQFLLLHGVLFLLYRVHYGVFSNPKQVACWQGVWLFADLLVWYHGGPIQVLLWLFCALLNWRLAYPSQIASWQVFFQNSLNLISAPLMAWQQVYRLQQQGKKRYLSFFYMVLILGISILFFVLYYHFNLVFKQFIDDLPFRMPNMSFVLLAVLFFSILVICCFPNVVEDTIRWESKQQTDIGKVTSFSIRHLDWAKAGIIVLILVNGITAINNSLDILSFFVPSFLPKDLSQSALVHRGVNGLIIAIVLAVLLILFIFKAEQHQGIKANVLKKWASIWLFQNILLVVIIGIRNGMYVHDFGITYKRIGVYIWLLLCLGGLFFTLIKIRKDKSLYWLILRNMTCLVTVLFAYAIPDWTYIISDYNIQRAYKCHSIDWDYLIRLDNGNCALLELHYPVLASSIQEKQEEDVIRDFSLTYTYSPVSHIETRIKEKISKFKMENEKKSFLSATIKDKWVRKYLDN